MSSILGRDFVSLIEQFGHLESSVILRSFGQNCLPSNSITPQEAAVFSNTEMRISNLTSIQRLRVTTGLALV
jgi:hypothetical protein